MSAERAKYVIVHKSKPLTAEDAAKSIDMDGRIIRSFSVHAPVFSTDTDDPVHFDKLGITYAWLTEGEAEALREKGDIESVHKPARVSGGGRRMMLQDVTEVLPVEEVPWNVSLVKADAAWATATGQGVKVAVLDSGITKSRADIVVAGGVSFVPGVSDWADDHGHGTTCAGLIGLKKGTPGLVGVAYDCSLFAVKVLDSTNSGYSDWIVAALLWAADQGMDIVSMSIWVTAGAAAPDEPPIPEIERAAQHCVDAGCLVVGIVGNSGSHPNHWVANHGRCPSVMGIGAVDKGKSWWAHDLYNVNEGGSAYGPPELPDNQAVELVAPGEYVFCAGRNPGEIVLYEGTSQACPHVAGAAALVKSINPQMKPGEIRQRLNATAQKLAVARRDDKLGFGLVDCQGALANV